MLQVQPPQLTFLLQIPSWFSVSPHVLLLTFSKTAAASSMLSKRAKSLPRTSPRNSTPHSVVTFRNFPNPFKSRACLPYAVAEQLCGDKLWFFFCFVFFRIAGGLGEAGGRAEKHTRSKGWVCVCGGVGEIEDAGGHMDCDILRRSRRRWWICVAPG